MGSGTQELIEREPAMTSLVSALQAGHEGRGAVAVVAAPAGMGKTRLCASVIEAADTLGLRVLRARGGEFEHDITFGVARQLFERLLLDAAPEEREELLTGAAALAAEALGVAGAGPPAADTGPVHGLYWLVANLGSVSPLVLVVDDAQWADAESLRFLLYLTRRIEGLAVAVVLASRPREPGSEALLIETIAAEPGVVGIELAPLSTAGSARLIAGRHDAVDPELAEACHRVAGGNPFYVSEMAAMLSGSAEPGVAPLERVRSLAPPSVRRSILMRLGGEAEPVRRVAMTLAVLHDDAPVGVIAAVSGLPVDAVVDALGLLSATGLAAADGANGLAHPIIRSAVYAEIPEARRRLLHGAAARALLDRGASDVAIAHHLALSEADGDPDVAARLLEAGEQALIRGAAATAERMLVRALAEPPAPELRPRAQAALGHALLAGGDRPAGVQRLRAALAGELPDPARMTAAMAASQALVEQGERPAALAELDAARERLGGDDALRLEAEHALVSMYDPVRSSEARARMRAFATVDAQTPAQRVALALAAVALAFEPGSTAEHVRATALRAAAEGRLVSEERPDSMIHSTAHYALLQAEDLDAFAAGVEVSRADAQRRGSAFGFLTASLGDLLGAVVRGDVVSAAGSADRAMELYPELAGAPVDLHWTSFAVRFSTEAHLDAGDLQRASDLVAGAGLLGDLDSLELCLVRYARGLVAAAQGEHAAALEDFLAYGDVSASTWAEDRLNAWRLGAARAAHGTGDGVRAIELADEALGHARVWGAPGGLGVAQRLRALVGDPREAADRLDAAVVTLRGSERRLELARALIDLGMALRRAGQRTAARAALEEGMETAARCGCPPETDRARAELVALGTRPRRLMFSGLEALTASERRVSTLAAEGSSNREIAQALFVTEKTVQTHLTSAYRKLDIRSRGELPDALLVPAAA